MEVKPMLPVTEIPPLVVESAGQFSSVFSWHQYRHFQRYLTGLMTDRNVTVSCMAGRFSEPVSQRSLNRFLTEYGWSPMELNSQRLKTLQEDPGMRWHSKGVVVIDDTLIEKSGKLIPGAGRLYDHAGNRFVHAQNLVTSHYADWRKHYPIAFRQYFKEDSREAGEYGFKSKIRLAMDLVDDAESRGVVAGAYVADSWFLCRMLVDHIESYGKNWVMAAKSSLLVWNKKQWTSLSEYAKQTPRELYRRAYAGGTPYWVHTCTVKLKSLDRKVKLAVSYDNKELEGDPLFTVSNVTFWDRNRILRAYCLRHLVETFYRDAKQHLGLEGCQLRTLEGVQRHWTLVFTAYSILKQGVVGSSLCKWLKARLQTIGDGCRYVTNQLLESLVTLVYRLAIKQQTPAEIMKVITM